MRKLELREAIREALVQEMRRDETVHLFGEDVAYYGGILGVTKGMLEEFGPDRVMDTPISESGFAGMAVGAALMGLRPVVEMQFTGLITVAMDQLVNTGAKARYVHDGAMSVPMVVRSPHMMHGNAYMSQALEAWFTHIPGFKVVTPSTPADAKALLITSIRDPDPVLYVEHEDLYGVTGPVPEGHEGIPLGQASVLREGTDVTVVAWLAMVPVAEAAAAKLADEGISVEVIDPRTLSAVRLRLLATVRPQDGAAGHSPRGRQARRVRRRDSGDRCRQRRGRAAQGAHTAGRQPGSPCTPRQET